MAGKVQGMVCSVSLGQVDLLDLPLLPQLMHPVLRGLVSVGYSTEEWESDTPPGCEIQLSEHVTKLYSYS